MSSTTAELAPTASLIVIDPNGRCSRVEIAPLPFKIGRQADNHVILRDSRASRVHAQIIRAGGEYVIEDADSRHGVFDHILAARANNLRVYSRRAAVA